MIFRILFSNKKYNKKYMRFRMIDRGLKHHKDNWGWESYMMGVMLSRGPKFLVATLVIQTSMACRVG